MCTVLLRVDPGARWPVLVGAIRDEFADRPWDPPAAHWDGPWAGLLGGRDREAGGTWLAVDPAPDRPAVAALLNGVRRPLPAGGARPTRGTLALEVLASGQVPSGAEIDGYDGFHLVLATLDGAQVWSWDGEALRHQRLPPGDHIVVNLGLDAHDDPLVPHFLPLLRAMPELLPGPGDGSSGAAWGPWIDLLGGDGLDPEDPRALLVRRVIDGRTYASTSAALVGLRAGGVRYDFSADPLDEAAWHPVTPVR